jgi:transcriptional regulator with XRE-family HTH domain
MAGTSQLTASFARVVRNHRVLQGLSQEALAEAAGIHHTYVGLLERGELRAPVEKSLSEAAG